MKTKIKILYQNAIAMPKFVMAHPFSGYEELKRYKKGKMSVAILYIILFALFRIARYQYEGFVINDRNPLNLNSLNEVLSVVLLIGLFTIGNWSVTTLMEGKGTYKEILMVTGYSLFPIVIIGFPAIILSNILTLEEIGFYNLLLGLAYFLSGWMLFMGILNIHQYGLFKTILSFIATVVSMAVMMFIGLLFFDLIQQFISFVYAIYEEITLRY